MQLTLKDFTRNVNGSAGDHMVAEIQQLGDEKTQMDTTDIIVDTSEEHRDIRIADGNTILKIQLSPDYTIQNVLKNDVAMTSTPPHGNDSYRCMSKMNFRSNSTGTTPVDWCFVPNPQS